MAVDPRAIEPGSTQYGDRQKLEAGLASIGGGEGGGSAGPAQPQAPSTTIPALGNPLGALLGGEIAPPDQQPLTSGLSVGPGDTPQQEPDPLSMPAAERLRMIAEQTTSPVLKRAALMQLRRMYRGVDRG